MFKSAGWEKSEENYIPFPQNTWNGQKMYVCAGAIQCLAYYLVESWCAYRYENLISWQEGTQMFKEWKNTIHWVHKLIIYE